MRLRHPPLQRIDRDIRHAPRPNALVVERYSRLLECKAAHRTVFVAPQRQGKGRGKAPEPEFTSC